MLGALARIPASTRFRAGRGIAIAVVTVASLGVGGLAAAGPGVFQAAANKARSLVTPDSADTEDAGAANGGDPLSGSQPDGTNGADAATGALASAIQQAAASDDCSSVPCGVGTTPAGVVTPTAPPPECADGNHGDAVSPVANGSVPPSAEEDHSSDVAEAAQSPCTPQTDAQDGNAGGEGGTNANQPEVTPGGPPSSTPAHEPATPPVTAPPVTAPTGRSAARHDAAEAADRAADLDARLRERPGQQQRLARAAKELAAAKELGRAQGGGKVLPARAARAADNGAGNGG